MKQDHAIWDGDADRLADFADRWRRARAAAFAVISPEGDEGAAVARLAGLAEDAQATVLRAVFDNSRSLGRSMARYFRRVFAPAEFKALFAAADVPCLAGTWEQAADGRSGKLTRAGCAHAGAASCDYWREAIDGLVMGLGDEARYTRHASLGAGDDRCVDVVYHAADQDHRLAEIPAPMREALAPVVAAYERNKARITLEGLAERTLYYRLETQFTAGCSAGVPVVAAAFGDRVSRLFPGIEAVEISAAAVMS